MQYTYVLKNQVFPLLFINKIVDKKTSFQQIKIQKIYHKVL